VPTGTAAGARLSACPLAGETMRTDSTERYSGGGGGYEAMAKAASTVAEVAAALSGAPHRSPPAQRRRPRPSRNVRHALPSAPDLAGLSTSRYEISARRNVTPSRNPS